MEARNTQAASAQPATTPVPNEAPKPAPDRHLSMQRRRWLLALALLFTLTGLGWYLYERLVSSRYESTDDAYVAGNQVALMPQLAGSVTTIWADANDRVEWGQPLVQLDDTDAKLALAQAEAILAQRVRETRALYTNNEVLQAQIKLRQAEVRQAALRLDQAKRDLARRQNLAGGAISTEELAHAQTQAQAAQATLEAAQAGVLVARLQMAGNRSMTEALTIEQHPSVLAAATQVRQAWLALQRTLLPAPVAGYVSQRHVQLGQRVAPGINLMTVVPLDQLWVDANFKEHQLRQLRLGQPVKLRADLYGKQVVYDGVVSGLGIATGAVSALLPAQNATGNWIKVVQRLPVRIALQADQVAKYPLRLGLSMLVDVDVSDQSGAMLAPAPRLQPLAQTSVYNQDAAQLEQLVQRIIRDNLAPKPAQP